MVNIYEAVAIEVNRKVVPAETTSCKLQTRSLKYMGDETPHSWTTQQLPPPGCCSPPSPGRGCSPSPGPGCRSSWTRGSCSAGPI